ALLLLLRDRAERGGTLRARGDLATVRRARRAFRLGQDALQVRACGHDLGLLGERGAGKGRRMIAVACRAAIGTVRLEVGAVLDERRGGADHGALEVFARGAVSGWPGTQRLGDGSCRANHRSAEVWIGDAPARCRDAVARRKSTRLDSSHVEI